MAVESKEHNFAVQRLAAFEEHLKEYRRDRALVYADPRISKEYKAALDEAVRFTFYAGYQAGLGSAAIDHWFKEKNAK